MPFKWQPISPIQQLILEIIPPIVCSPHSDHNISPWPTLCWAVINWVSSRYDSYGNIFIV